MKKPFTPQQTWLACMSCGFKADLLTERLFKCPNCGNLYDVMHQYPGESFAKLTEQFDFRAQAGLRDRSTLTAEAMYSSGVWRFHELIMPHLPVSQVVSLGEGNVPIIKAGKRLRDWVGVDELYMILEGKTQTGSFKDFGGTVMMSIAKAAGIQKVGCASTGDTSAMLAAYAAAAGLECVVILPEGQITPTQLAQPLVHGAKVITLPGVFDDCMRVVEKLVSQEKIFPGNSLNPTRIEGHQATVFLLAQFFGWELPEWIALPVGNGSNCSSVGKAMRVMRQLGYQGQTSRILGCQSEAAKPLALSWLKAQFICNEERRFDEFARIWRDQYEPQLELGETNASAAKIGQPVSWKKVVREVDYFAGRMNVVPEALLNEAVAVCGRDGYHVCPQTGTALAGVKLAVNKGDIRGFDRVAVVSTADGLKFTDSAAQDLMGNIIKAKSCRPEEVADLLS
jgi:threonine synthase